MKKSAAVLVLLLFLCVVMVSLPEIGTVRAEDTIHIKSDGSVEGTDKIQRVGNVYSFTDNVYGSIIVERGNVVIDGAGYQLQGNDSDYGIKLESSGVTIKNAKISNSGHGIYVYYTSHNNIIVDNDINGNSRGIYVRGTSNNTITGNKITNNSDGIHLSGTDNILKNNQMKDNSYNFGITPQPNYNDIDTSNTVNGKPIYYWTNQHDRTVPLDAGCVILINCTNIEVQNLTLANNREGILLVNTERSEIRNCTLSNNKSGIRIRISSDINITQNVFTENGEGITVWESTDILVNENQIANNTESGIELFDSKEHNTIADNQITSCPVGIEFTASSNNNTVSGNSISNCTQAILFTTSTYNTLRNNSMFNNENHFRIQHDHYNDASLELPYLINDIDSSNTVNGKPMYYWINQQNKTVPSNAGYVALVNCTGISLSNLKDVSGVLVAFTTNSLISQNRIEKSDFGIKIWRGANNRIVANHLTGNEVGLSISYSTDNDVYWNNISNNTHGIGLSGPSGNNIFRNIISNNKQGMYLDWSNNNTIYNNNFIDNTRHFYDTTGAAFPWLAPSSNHNWNHTYPIGGNYWSNLTGVDLKSGQNQNLIGSDGIIDTPFELQINNTDNYPIADPILFFDAGIWEWNQYFVNCISNSTLSDFIFNPLEGAFIRFNATGETATSGFCRIIVPKGLLTSQNGWNVIINGESVTPTISEDQYNTYIYFTYNHSTKTIEIHGTAAIPEFPSWIIIPLFLMAALAAVIVRKRLTQSSERF
ncbi:MAG: hypothetical protein CW716_10480 [Candidatus Bathyarchaeum sp.]|nr:MAG: hypothetical protein CW716_10480 [Candidatus Bathyarchaeum sp.]